jgi:hypothetical protein
MTHITKSGRLVVLNNLGEISGFSQKAIIWRGRCVLDLLGKFYMDLHVKTNKKQFQFCGVHNKSTLLAFE